MPARRLWLLLLLVAAPSAAAQMLPSGTWTGAVERGEASAPVEAAIERCATGFSVDLRLGDQTARTETATWADGRLQFRLPRLRMPEAPRARALACTVRQRDDGTLAGVCRSGGDAWRLALAPPADAAFGCKG